MREEERELSIGDVLKIGNHVVTVVDVDGAEACFRVEKSEKPELGLQQAEHSLPPLK